MPFQDSAWIIMGVYNIDIQALKNDKWHLFKNLRKVDFTGKLHVYPVTGCPFRGLGLL